MKCTIKRVKEKDNQYDLFFKGLTNGQILAMKNALYSHADAGSACAEDLHAFLINGADEIGLGLE